MSAPEDGFVFSSKVSNELSEKDLMNGASDIWKNSSPYFIPISRLWQKDNVNLGLVQVQAVFNKNYIAIKLQWDDQTEDSSTYRVQDFQDMVAIQFSMDEKMGFYGMGSRMHSSNIWSWKAEHQLRKDMNAHIDSQLDYPNRASDAAVETYPEIINETQFLPGRDAKNILSASDVKIIPATNLDDAAKKVVKHTLDN